MSRLLTLLYGAACYVLFLGTFLYAIAFVSGVGARSKEVAYGKNRADFSFIAGGVVPGVLVLKPDLPDNTEDWPFFWGQNEYVVNMTPSYIKLVQAAIALTRSNNPGEDGA